MVNTTSDPVHRTEVAAIEALRALPIPDPAPRVDTDNFVACIRALAPAPRELHGHERKQIKAKFTRGGVVNLPAGCYVHENVVTYDAGTPKERQDTEQSFWRTSQPVGLDQALSIAAVPRDVFLELIQALGRLVSQKSKGTSIQEITIVTSNEFFSNSSGQLEMFPGNGDGHVVLPEGASADETGKNIEKSMAHIVHGQPDEATIRRFLARYYHDVTPSLTWGIIRAVHRFAEQGLLPAIDKAAEVRPGETNPKLAALIVQAYDMLDLACTDIRVTVEQLCAAADVLASNDCTEADIAAVTEGAARIRVAHESDIDKMLRILSATTPSDTRLAVRELRYLAQRAEAHPKRWRPSRIDDLNEGQVRRIAEAAGVIVERVSADVDNDIRELLVDTDQSDDQDLLLTLGYEAFHRGQRELFSEALVRRSSGDLSWADDLNEVLAAV